MSEKTKAHALVFFFAQMNLGTSLNSRYLAMKML